MTYGTLKEYEDNNAKILFIKFENETNYLQRKGEL